jgi:glycosyltransferase involved in cell wall biosynthesis
MKILIVNTSDIQGGAARAAYRLHSALLACGVDSQMLVQNKSSDDYTVIAENKKIKKYLANLRPIIDSLPVRFYKDKTKTLFSPSWLPFGGIVDKINEINPDIVHLHWIAAGMMRIEDIAKIKAPIVWSLHDMWAFTGGCHYDEECGGYKEICGNCKILGSNKEKDLSRKIFERKQKTFRKKDMTIVGLSRWLNDASNKSTLLKEKNHINLPNPIDTTIFKPFDKAKSRALWNLPRNKKLVLFGAMGATSDPRKGFKELGDAMRNLTSQDIEFVVFGSSKPKDTPDFGFKTHYLGSLSDDVSLVTLYSAVDVMVVPSLQEAFGQTASESMACATPVVAFGATGLLDIVDHQTNGYLAKPFESEDLAHGIEWVLDAPNYDELCLNAREKVVKEFDCKIVAEKYVKLYEEILHG